MAFFVNSLVVSNYTPEAASELPVIGVYYTFNIFLVATALSGSVLVLKLHFRGHKLHRVPRWLLKLFLIESQKLKDERSNSALLQMNMIQPKIKIKPLQQNSLYDLKEIKNGYLPNITINRSSSYNRKSPVYQMNDKIKEKKDIEMSKLTKLTVKSFKRIEDEKKILKNIEEITIEWKELARRLDYLFLVLSAITIVTVPLILFGKFVVRDISNNLIQSNCGCEHTFI